MVELNKNQKRTLVLAGIIGTLFACYDEDEKTRLHKELHKRIGVGTRKMVKQYGEKAVVQVVHVEGNAIWENAVDHFSEQKITIEASACVLTLWNLDEKGLARYFGLSTRKIGEWAKPSQRADRIALERASRDVEKHVVEKVDTLYGIEVEKKMSVMERIALARKSA